MNSKGIGKRAMNKLSQVAGSVRKSVQGMKVGRWLGRNVKIPANPFKDLGPRLQFKLNCWRHPEFGEDPGVAPGYRGMLDPDGNP